MDIDNKNDKGFRPPPPIDKDINFFRYIVFKARIKPNRIYKRCGWTRQQFWGYMKPNREVSPRIWKHLRRALKWTAPKFYRHVRYFFDAK